MNRYRIYIFNVHTMNENASTNVYNKSSIVMDDDLSSNVDVNGSFFQNIGVHFSQLFSNPVMVAYWILGLKWYVILFMLVIGTFLFFQIESAIEKRKEKRKNKKEGMNYKNVDKMRGIIRDSDENHKHSNALKKRVSFNDSCVSRKHESNYLQYFNLHSFIINGVKNVKEFFVKLYNLWIVPFVYVTFRNIGIR